MSYLITSSLFLLLFFFLNPHLRTCLLILERESKKPRSGALHVCPNRGNWTCNRGLCPDWGSYPQLLVYETMLQPTEPPSQSCFHLPMGFIKSSRNRSAFQFLMFTCELLVLCLSQILFYRMAWSLWNEVITIPSSALRTSALPPGRLCYHTRHMLISHTE